MKGFKSRARGTSSESSDHGMLSRSEDNRCLDCPVMEPLFSEWTDEKHSLYIKTMEASFVEQLYGSINMINGCSPKQKLPGPEASRKTQFVSGEKISRSKAMSSSGKEAKLIKSASTLKPLQQFHTHFCSQDMIGDITEVSDQNFVNETLEEEKASIHSLKLNTPVDGTSSQVTEKGKQECHSVANSGKFRKFQN